jgi:hypothetical protein
VGVGMGVGGWVSTMQLGCGAGEKPPALQLRLKPALTASAVASDNVCQRLPALYGPSALQPRPRSLLLAACWAACLVERRRRGSGRRSLRVLAPPAAPAWSRCPGPLLLPSPRAAPEAVAEHSLAWRRRPPPLSLRPLGSLLPLPPWQCRSARRPHPSAPALEPATTC